MALTNDEKTYIKKLRQAWADDENVLYYLKQRRNKETLQNQPEQQGVFSKIAQFPVALWQGLVTGTVRGVGNIAKFGGNVIDKALPGDYLKRGTEALQRGTEWLAGGIEWINKDLTQNVGQNVGQFASNFIGGMWLVKWGAKLATKAGGLLSATKTGANLLSKTSPILSPLWKVWQYAKWSTLWAKATNLWLKSGKWWAIWGVETAGYDAVSKGEISPTNVAIGSVFSAMLPVAGIGLKKLAGYTTGKLPQTLQLQGLMNPAKVTMLKGKLMTEWVSTPQDLGKWMLDRNIKWNKETIINTLLSRADKSYKAVDDSLASISGAVTSPTAKKALQQTYDDLSKIAWLEDEAQNILKLISKDKFTLSELNKVKRILDDQYNIYTKTGDPTAWMKAKWLQKIRSTIQKTIEDEAETLWVKNIKSLNNETQIARGMADAISRKDSADAVREALTAFAPSGIGGIAGWFAWPFDKSTPQWFIGNVLLGMFAGKVLWSTTLKTNIASLLNKLSKQEIGALDAYIRSGGKTALTPKIIQTMDDTLKLLPPASWKPVSASVVDVKPMTGFSPGRMQAQQQAIGSKVWKQPLTTAIQQNPWVAGVTPLSSTQWVQQQILPKAPSKKLKTNDDIIPRKPKTPIKDTPEVKEMGGLPKTTKFDSLETKRKSLAEKVNNKDLTTEERVIATRDMYETMLDQYKMMGKQDKIPELKAQIKEINKVIEERWYFDIDVNKIKKIQNNVIKDEKKASETLSELKKKYWETPASLLEEAKKYKSAEEWKESYNKNISNENAVKNEILTWYLQDKGFRKSEIPDILTKKQKSVIKDFKKVKDVDWVDIMVKDVKKTDSSTGEKWGTRYVIAVDNGKIVWTADWWLDWIIQRIWVDREYRNKWIWSNMMKEIWDKINPKVEDYDVSLAWLKTYLKSIGTNMEDFYNKANK